ncbi:hypothetical protein OsI_12383 [Oryza sativa Indica Group]|uniref:Uncharacterized protein n=1 Tax=Oryza sativa subsp. indica TaxID=39946 RepID=A2XIX0_ORYSI|nr:hypothetical protein OsI_12383 [Oryza sativa Indica Group]
MEGGGEVLLPLGSSLPARCGRGDADEVPHRREKWRRRGGVGWRWIRHLHGRIWRGSAACGGARLGAATVALQRNAAGGGGGGPVARSGTWQGGGGSGGAPLGSSVPAAGSDSRMARVVMAGVAGDGRTARAEGRRMCDGRTPTSRSMRAAPCSGPTWQWLAPAMLAAGPRG